MTDPIADMLTRIKNGYRAGKKTVLVPHSKIKNILADLLVKNNFIKSSTMLTTETGKMTLEIQLLYRNKAPVVTDIKRVSSPGLRRYVGYRSIPIVVGGQGLVILSTPEGLLTGKQARKKKIGGEIICKVW